MEAHWAILVFSIKRSDEILERQKPIKNMYIVLQDDQRWGKIWTKIKEKNKDMTIFWYREDHQALAFSLRRPSCLWRSGCAYVEYVADMKLADTLWTSTDSLPTSIYSRRTSTDSLLTSTDSLLTCTDSLLNLYWLLLTLYWLLLTLYWLLLTLYWLLLTSTDSLLTSTDSLLTSTGSLLTLYWLSTYFYWLSTDFYWPFTDCQIQSGTFEHSLEQPNLYVGWDGMGLAGSWNWLTTRAPLGGANK